MSHALSFAFRLTNGVLDVGLMEHFDELELLPEETQGLEEGGSSLQARRFCARHECMGFQKQVRAVVKRDLRDRGGGAAPATGVRFLHQHVLLLPNCCPSLLGLITHTANAFVAVAGQ